MTLITRPLAVLLMLALALCTTVALAAPAAAADAGPKPCIPGMTPPIWDGAPDFSCYN